MSTPQQSQNIIVNLLPVTAIIKCSVEFLVTSGFRVYKKIQLISFCISKWKTYTFHWNITFDTACILHFVNPLLPLTSFHSRTPFCINLQSDAFTGIILWTKKFLIAPKAHVIFQRFRKPSFHTLSRLVISAYNPIVCISTKS